MTVSVKPIRLREHVTPSHCLQHRQDFGQQFGLGLSGLWKANLQHLGNPLVVLLAGAPQQGLIGGLLDQRMLEDVRRLRWQPLLVQELRLHELVQPRRKVASSHRETACSSS